MPYVNYVELKVPDTKQAAEFYKKAFGWNAQSWDDSGYMVVDNGDEPGIGAGIEKLEGDQPSTVAVITVPSLDESAKAVKAAGGKITVEKFPVSGQGYAAYFTTPGGLLMGIYEQDESAA